MASVLERGVARSSDFVARYGGEEFVILLPATGLDGATAIAERLRRDVEALELRHEQSSVAEVLTISIGLAVSTREGPGSPHDLIAAADRALYYAKQAGRNRISQAT